MVYRGPSKGCQTCRTRRIKCDYTEPECLNCRKRKVFCPGFRSAFDAVHRDQNAVVQGRVERRKMRVEPQPCALPDFEFVSVSYEHQRPDEDVLPTIALPTIPRQVWQAIEASALSFFFANYGLARDSRTTCGWLEWLPALYMKADDGSPLTAATTALAVNITMLWQRQSVDSLPARSLYAKAVTSTKLAIMDPAQNTSDELLMTAFILEFYDILSARYRNQPLSQTHAKGALAILKHRGELNFKNELSKRMVISARTLLAHQALICSGPVDLDADIWQDCKPMPQSPATELIVVEANLANLLHKYRLQHSQHAQDPGEDPAHYLYALLQEAEELDYRLDHWVDHIPDDWHPKAVARESVAPSIQKAGFYGSHCTVYLDIAVVHTWDFYRRIRFECLILIHRCFRALAALGEHIDDAVEIEIQQRLQRVVDDLCDSLPFHIGDLTQPTNPLFYGESSFPGGIFLSERFGQKRIITMPTTQADHAHRAVSSGGWFLLGPLYSLARHLKEGHECGGITVRDGQLEWIDEQVRRLQTIYFFPPP